MTDRKEADKHGRQHKPEIKIPTAAAREAYTALRGAQESLEDHELIPLRYEDEEAAARGIFVGRNALRDLQLFESFFTMPPKEEIDSLAQRALSIVGAAQIEGTCSDALVLLRSSSRYIVEALVKSLPMP